MIRTKFMKCSCGNVCKINTDRPDIKCWKCGRVVMTCAICSSKHDGSDAERCGTCTRFSEFEDGGVPIYTRDY